jgi:hypothetical protein
LTSSQQAATVFVVQPLAEVVDVQRIGGADHLQQLAQFARQVGSGRWRTAVVIDFRPGQARLGCGSARRRVAGH